MAIDKRVQRTDKALKDAFRSLSKTNSFQEITVKKLTEKAGINRKTFYLHYDSIDDFQNTFVNELVVITYQLFLVPSLSDHPITSLKFSSCALSYLLPANTLFAP